MAKKKKAARKAARGRKAAKTGKRTIKKAAGVKTRKPAGKKGTQPRAFRRVANLAAEALGALATGNLQQVRSYLEAIRAVSLCADEAG